MQRILLQPAFILHRQAYRDTSLLVDVLTHQYGKIKLVARSARGLKSRFQGRLQLFTPLLLSYSGRHDLKSLNNVEANGSPYKLAEDHLLCGFYLNELLVRLLKHDDPSPQLYTLYQNTLMQLDKTSDVLPTLRIFEKKLLDAIGYGLPLDKDTRSGQPIQADYDYIYIESQGFVLADPFIEKTLTISGATLIALAQENIQQPKSLQQAKQLLRHLIGQQLGSKPLKSRELMC